MMKESENYRAAADYIRAHGWHQGTGESYREPGDLTPPRVCILRSISIVYPGWEFDLADNERTRWYAEVVEPRLSRLAGCDSLAIWNDEPGRTVDEVLNILDKAAEEAAAEEVAQ